MISKWRADYTDEEKSMALTIINKNQEINKLVDELEEQERHIKEADFEIERLNNIIKEVREYIKERTEFGEYTYAYPGVLNQDEVREINRILDKENI